MNKYDVIHAVLDLIQVQQQEKVKTLLRQKVAEYRKKQVYSKRTQIAEIIKEMALIDREIFRFQRKKMQFERVLETDSMTSLDNYITVLIERRRELVKEKKKATG
ncbi:hypothetical protein P8864_11515 [Priestia flexa]|uniref:hypothetical protein n=1 Tax=Priestia flexa TaxID=86664 RepID=UPI000C23DF5D|nr:hypothetical protein [Priestia flexa]MEC0666515.1 hypothetical protein [Priestia flexa]